MRTATTLMILAPLKPFIREAPLPDVVKTLVPPILFLLPVRSTATYNHTMFDTRRPPCEKGQSLVLAIPMLALTLIAPWAFGQDLDPLTEILRQADQGNASAQSYLGFMYEIGEGVSKNEAEAMKWYRLAADQGEAVAQINLGRMYADGRGVPENDTEAVKWFRLAADQGVADAQFNLGVMYADGQGVPENDTEAVKWFRLAADQDVADAQFNLGVMYADGQGVPEDYVLGFAWLNLAAAQGNERASEYRDNLQTRMNADQIAQAQEMSATLSDGIKGSE